ECYIRDKIIYLNYKIQEPQTQEYTGDIDREIIKIAVEVLDIYEFRDYSLLKINNLVSGKKAVFGQAKLKDFKPGAI
ncbi:MAG: hypothetical protein ACE5GG_05765, partial [Candidatus Omnitrophota bacterium]